METTFKVGDRVLCTDNGKYGNINTIDDTDDYGEVWYGVLFDDGEEAWLEDELLELTDVDKKTAFLNELKELLERYDAKICDYDDYCVLIKIGDEWLSWHDTTLSGEGVNPSNIFNYDK